MIKTYSLMLYSLFHSCSIRKKREHFSDVHCKAILTVTSPIVITVPTRGLLAVETKDSFVLWLEKFEYQEDCLQTVSITILTCRATLKIS